MGGKIYGGTASIGHLFVHDPATGTSTDLGQAVAGIENVNALTVSNGKIYGGTAQSGMEAHLFVHDPNTASTTDLGVAVAGEDQINALTTGNDGKIYGSTGWGDRFFVFDPSSNVFTDKGTGAPGGGIYALTTAPDGTIYGGSTGGHLFTYDPSSGIFTDLDKPVSEDYYIYSLVFGADGVLYGGTGNRNGHVFTYDPATAITTDLGRAVWGTSSVHALARGNDGKIYGGGAELFAYDPADHPYRSSGTAISTEIIPGVRDIITAPANNYVYALTRGADGKIYGGGGYNGHIFVYDPSTDALTDLGQAVSGESYIYALTTGDDDKIYGGTYGFYDTSGHLFVFDPGTGDFTDIGQAVPGVRGISALTTGSDGRIYGGTYGNYTTPAHLFVYDPATGSITDKGQVSAKETDIAGLTTGSDGKIYGVTRWHGHFFVYDPATDLITDKWTSASDDNEFQSITTGGDDKIYAGLGSDGHLLVYNPASDAVTDLGSPVGGGYAIMALTASGDKVYGVSWRYRYGYYRSILFAYDTSAGTTRVIGHPVSSEPYVYSLATGSDETIYGGTGYTYGHLFSYDPNYVFDWGGLGYSASTPAGTGVNIDVLSQEGALLLDNVSSGGSLASIDPTTFPSIKLRAELWTTDGTSTPHLLDWRVAWPSVQTSVQSLAFILDPSGPTTVSRTVQISAASDETVYWTALDDQTWLSCHPNSGTAPAGLSVQVDTSGLAQGWHNDTIAVDWSTATASGSQEIDVVLYLGEHWDVFLPLAKRDN